MMLFEVLAAVSLIIGIANTVAIVLLARAATSELAMGTSSGLPLGAALPAFAADSLDGTRLTDESTRGRLLLFLGATCRPCHTVVRELAAVASSELPPLVIGVTGEVQPGHDDLFELLDFVPKGALFADPHRSIADRLGVPGTPFVYAVDREGQIRAKTAATSVQKIQAVRRFTGRA